MQEKAGSTRGNFRPEFVPEDKIVNGKLLYRFTFSPNSVPDLSGPFYEFVIYQFARMDYNHVTIHCPDGHPAWLTAFFRKLAHYGLPVEVTPAPTNAALVAAIDEAARYTPFKWDDNDDHAI